jgi:DNA-binding MarR family transcriptional regulator
MEAVNGSTIGAQKLPDTVSSRVKRGSTLPAIDASNTLDCLAGYLLIHRASRRLSAALAKSFSAFGVDESAFQLLALLQADCGGKSTPAVLADMTAQSRTNLTHLGDTLEALGLVTRYRDEQDRRRVHLCLTADGYQCVADMAATFALSVSDVVAAFEPNDAVILARLLRDVIRGKARSQLPGRRTG